MSGYIARRKGGVGFNSEDLEFFRDKKTKYRKEKIFQSREECIEFFKREYNCGKFELAELIWFEEGEDIQRSLVTNAVIDPYYLKRKEEEKQDDSGIDEGEDSGAEE